MTFLYICYEKATFAQNTLFDLSGYPMACSRTAGEKPRTAFLGTKLCAGREEVQAASPCWESLRQSWRTLAPVFSLCHHRIDCRLDTENEVQCFVSCTTGENHSSLGLSHLPCKWACLLCPAWLWFCMNNAFLNWFAKSMSGDNLMKLKW